MISQMKERGASVNATAARTTVQRSRSKDLESR